jgi:hypothetical protein
MSSTTAKTNVVKDTRAKIAELREKHQPIFDAMGITEALYIPKLAYKPPGKEEKCIAFFPSEVAKGEDIYTEFVSHSYESEDPKRLLRKWRYNPYYEQEYDKTDPHPTSGSRYLVPVSELEIVEETSVVSNKNGNRKPLVDPEVDIPMNQLTSRDLYAIFHNKAISNKPSINELIKKYNG